VEEVIKQIIEAQEAQLAKPARACVNSESSFVAQRLRQSGFAEAAKLYWNWVTTDKRAITDVKVIELEAALKVIDSHFTMPDWGCRGT